MPAPKKSPGVFVAETLLANRTIAGVATATTVFIGPTVKGRVNHIGRVASVADFERRFGGVTAGLETGFAVRQFLLNGGRDLFVVRVAQRATAAQLRKALQALNAIEFNLLAIPGVTNGAVLAGAAEYCRERRAILLVDPPSRANSVARVRQVVAGYPFAGSPNAAVYYPWILIRDKTGARTTAPSGTIAGIIARTDASRGIRKAPAGIESKLNGVKSLAAALTDAEAGALNVEGINGLRTFPASGPVVWGARTLAGRDALASEFKYLPVRRLALFIEASVDRGTRWAVFEPNAEPLWASLRLNVENFLDGLFRQRAFAGATPTQAYYVRCDRTTMTAADIGAGRVMIVVGFAPLRPAEFVVLTVRQSVVPGEI